MSLFQQVTIVDGGEESPLRWRTAKVQQLFLYLVQHRGTAVNKTVIIELLWPELEPEKAYHQLYTAIYHIRKTLAPFSKYFQISNTSEGYKVRLEQTILDVDQFERFFRSDLSLSAETIGEYEQAIALCKGDYLQEHNYIWAESERRYPLEEIAYFYLMKIFADMGRHSSVHKQYDQLTSVLWKELQEQPNPAITEWYHLWKQKNKE